MKVMMLANAESTILHFRQEVIEAFCSNGMTVVACYPLGSNTKTIRSLGCTVRDVKLDRHGTNPLADLKLQKAYEKLMREEQPDVVLTYTVKPNIYGSIAARKFGIPYINNITGLGSTQQSSSFVGTIVRVMQKIAYKDSFCIFFQNQANRDFFLKSNIIDSNVHTEVLPGSGVNLTKMAYIPFPKDDGVVRFIVVSRLRFDKGYSELLDAYEMLDKSKQRVELHIVGWSEDENLFAQISRLSEEGHVIFHGELTQEQVHDAIAKCDCIVHPSHHEGMSNVLLEAAATGRGILASNIPGCKEAFIEGVSGFGFNAHSATSIKNAMERYLALTYDQRKEMGIRGRKKMEAEFDRSLVAKAYVNRICLLNREKEEQQ